MMYRTVTVQANLAGSLVEVFPALSDNITVDAQLTTAISHSDFDEYEGPYEFTPTQETQTAYTANKVLTENIIINPIPSNYGLITYNGSVLTVS